jgi:hypothetical protein
MLFCSVIKSHRTRQFAIPAAHHFPRRGIRAAPLDIASARTGCSAKTRGASVSGGAAWYPLRVEGPTHELHGAMRSGISDVTDRSHHWIGAIFCQIIPGLKCLGGFRVGCPFLGRKQLFLAFSGVRWAISPVLGPGGQNRRISGSRDPGRHWARSIGPDGSKPARRQRTITGSFRRNGTEKVHVWYRCSP